jgi:plasmid maintenance system antidote protein VapI
MTSALRSVVHHNALPCGSTADTDFRLARHFGLSEGFFPGLQMDYDLMQRRREIDGDLKAIRPRAAA